jgi:hypothetical protein
MDTEGPHSYGLYLWGDARAQLQVKLVECVNYLAIVSNRTLAGRLSPCYERALTDGLPL